MLTSSRRTMCETVSGGRGDVTDVQRRVGLATDDVTDMESWCGVAVTAEKSETSESEVSSSQSPYIRSVTNRADQVMSLPVVVVGGLFTGITRLTHISNNFFFH